jgi:hypothetical protein
MAGARSYASWLIRPTRTAPHQSTGSFSSIICAPRPRTYSLWYVKSYGGARAHFCWQPCRILFIQRGALVEPRTRGFILHRSSGFLKSDGYNVCRVPEGRGYIFFSSLARMRVVVAGFLCGYLGACLKFLAFSSHYTSCSSTHVLEVRLQGLNMRMVFVFKLLSFWND